MCLGKVVLEADATQSLLPAGHNCSYSLSCAKSAVLKSTLFILFFFWYLSESKINQSSLSLCVCVHMGVHVCKNPCRCTKKDTGGISL